MEDQHKASLVKKRMEISLAWENMSGGFPGRLFVVRREGSVDGSEDLTRST